MKANRLLLLSLAVMMAVGGAQAQYSDLYYHRVGDTIEWKAPNGFYSWWEFERFYQENLTLEVRTGELWGVPQFADSSITLQRFFTPSPLKIIGIAAAIYSFREGDYYYQTPCASSYNNYLCIYDADTSGIRPLKMTPWNIFDSTRTLHLKGHDTPGIFPFDSCCYYFPHNYHLPLYEYYFDSALYVTDSFYVGGTLFWNYSDTIIQGYYHAFIAGAGPIICDPDLQYGSSCLTHTQPILNMQLYGSLWFTFYYEGHPGIVYPIVEVDTTMPPEGVCLAVSGIEVPLVDSGCVTVTWDDFPNYTSVQLACGLANAPPSEWPTVDVTGSTLHRICGLQAGRYGVRLRASCDKGETEWSSPVYFLNTGLPEPPDTTSVIPTALSACTYLSPNPASGTVWVTSGFNLRRVDIYNTQGILVHSQSVYDHHDDVSLEGLLPGTYIVAIVTYNGTTHKKLVVR